LKLGHHFRLVVLVISIIAIVALAFLLWRQGPAPGAPEVYEVSIGELKANYQQYDGKKVRTSGSLSTLYGASTIHYLYDENGLIEVIFPAMNPGAYEGENIEITGYVCVENLSMFWVEVENVRVLTSKQAFLSFQGTDSDPEEHEAVVLLIEFQDVTHEDAHDQDYFRMLLFSNARNANSMNNYYQEVSYGQISSISGTVSEWYTSEHDMDWYGEDSNVWRHDDRNTDRYELAREAIQLADDDIDFSQFDKDGDGLVDHVIVVHAGPAQERAGGLPDEIWSHRWEIPGGERVDGVRVVGYTAQSESSPLGIFAHEFGHDIGLPDLYDTDMVQEFVGNWDLMDHGSWNNDGNTPAQMCAWDRIKLGWLQPYIVERDESMTLALHEIEQDWGTRAVKVTLDKNIYYLIEARQQINYDSALPDHGVLITYCDDLRGSGQGPVRVRDAHPNVPADWVLDDAAFDVSIKRGENSLYEDFKNGVTVTVSSAEADGYFWVNIVSGHPVPTFAGDISRISPSSFTGDQWTTVTVRIWNLGVEGGLVVNCENIPSGWSVQDMEADADNYEVIRLNNGASGSVNFLVRPPALGGVARLTWKLYYFRPWIAGPPVPGMPGSEGRYLPLNTCMQLVWATSTITPQYEGDILSADPDTFTGGETVRVTVGVGNRGSAGTLMIIPENVPPGWRVEDGEPDLDNYKTIYLASGTFGEVDFYVTPPLSGGTAALTWVLRYQLSRTENISMTIYLDNYQQSVSATTRALSFIGNILSTKVENLRENIVGGITTRVTIELTNIGDNCIFFITPENIPENWVISKYYSWVDVGLTSSYVITGAIQSIDFYITAPDNGGSKNLTWVLYYGERWLENLRPLHTYYQYIVAMPKRSGEILSATPNVVASGENAQVTVTIRNTGDAAALIVAPEQVTKGWSVDDNEPDAGNAKTALLKSWENASLIFVVRASENGGSGDITWKLYFENLELDSYYHYLVATSMYSGMILSAEPDNVKTYENAAITVTIKNTGKAGTLIVRPENYRWNVRVDDNEPDENNYKTTYLNSGETTLLTFIIRVESWWGDVENIYWKLYYSDWRLLDSHRQELSVSYHQ